MTELCMICGVSLDIGYTECLPCNHAYHYECIMKTYQMSCLGKKGIHHKNRCPYCRKSSGLLPIVNGLTKLHAGIHYEYLSDIPPYVPIKCNHVMTRGKHKGCPCNRKCQTGFYVCKMHNKPNKHKNTNLLDDANANANATVT